jgi:hypothetical protein
MGLFTDFFIVILTGPAAHRTIPSEYCNKKSRSAFRTYATTKERSFVQAHEAEFHLRACMYQVICTTPYTGDSTVDAHSLAGNFSFIDFYPSMSIHVVSTLSALLYRISNL